MGKNRVSKTILIIEEIFYIFMAVYGALILTTFTLGAFNENVLFGIIVGLLCGLFGGIFIYFVFFRLHLICSKGDVYEEDLIFWRRFLPGYNDEKRSVITENKKDVNLIICHIGSGASMSAIKNGKSCDTTMGLTPLDGLMMGTRSGSIDPSIIEYICKERNLTVSEVTNILNKESGLKGISGVNDFRDVTALAKQGNHNAKLAIKLFEKSIVKYIAQYYFELNGDVDAIIFTAGVGENMSYVREDIVNLISKPMGIKINKEINDNIAKFKQYQSGVITTDDSKIKVMVIPTNEELMILKDTVRLTKKSKDLNKEKKLNK